MGFSKGLRVIMLLRLLSLILTCFFLICQPVYSQALSKPEPERVNRAISGTLQQGMNKRGFAANDHRFANTIARASPALSAIAGSAAVITVGTVTAPAWASVALAAGVGAIVTYAVSLAVDGLVNWLFKEETIEVSGNINKLDELTLGGAYWYSSEIYGTNGVDVARAALISLSNGSNLDSIICPQVHTDTTVLCSIIGPFGIRQDRQANYFPNGSPVSCPLGQIHAFGECTFADSDDTNLTEDLSPQEAIETLSDSEISKPLNPALIAALANQAWRQAALTPNYDGLPFPESNPLTEHDAADWIEANPNLAPTVQDFISPNINTNPWAIPSNPYAPSITPPNPNEGTTNPNEDQPPTNLGPDPNIGAPNLEPIPTAKEILQPIINLLPDLKNYKTSTKSGVCPRPTIELYGTHTLEAHCLLIEDNKEILQAAMLLAWALIALFIVLSA